MAGSDVPFHRATQPGVQVGLAGGQQAQLERRPGSADGRHPAPGQVARQKSRQRRGVAMRPAGQHRQAVGRHRAASHAAAARRVLHRGTKAHRTHPQTPLWPQGRRQHHAQHRQAVFDQCDVDGELAIALDELLGAVQRVHQPEAVTHLGRVAGGHGLFGHHRDVRGQRRQPGQDHRLGTLVGLGHRRGIGLALHRKISGVNRHDHGAGLAGERGQRGQQGGRGFWACHGQACGQVICPL